jgi:hypothetical protein
MEYSCDIYKLSYIKLHLNLDIFTAVLLNERSLMSMMYININK